MLSKQEKTLTERKQFYAIYLHIAAFNNFEE